MKVLSMAWSIYDERIEQFCTNCTGGGLVIKNICEYIGRLHESYLFVGRFKLPGLKLGNIQLIDTQSMQDVEEEGLDKDEIHLRTMEKAFEKAIEEVQPDIVNIHGIGVLAKRCIYICKKKGLPCVYTEHLYIGKDKRIANYERVIEWEQDLYAISDLPIITVSTGMKKRIVEDFPAIEEKNVYVIKNGTDFQAQYVSSFLKQDYSLENKKVLLCVGTLLERKNQKQLVRVFQLLDEKLQDQIRIIFCGNDGMNGELQKEIQAAGLESKLMYVGAISSEDMKKYYSVAAGLVMPSLAEGLSIAALEAISYGLPVIMFSDSECAEDLSDERVIAFAEQRTDKDLAEAITKWYKTDWDKEYIVRYAKQFTMERVAEDYISCYKRILEK